VKPSFLTPAVIGTCVKFISVNLVRKKMRMETLGKQELGEWALGLFCVHTLVL
jgi:xanthine/uracil permease